MTNNSTDRPASPATADDAADERDEPGGGALFPIVGIGASAGGLEAFTELLKHLPLETGMGFVLVQHLDPHHESALTQLLARATSLPVREVTNNLRVEANRVYVIPPNTTLGIAQGVLKLEPRRQTRTPHRSIDFFFKSLAQDQRGRAIGVILSGTATDGTLGLEAIKAEGGITFAQDESARYDSMPRSAVGAGCVDFILSPENIAKELARIAKHPYVAGKAPEAVSPEDDRASATAHEDETPLPSGGRGAPRTQAKLARAEAGAARGKAGGNGFKKILLLLRNHSGVDFSLYKSTTIQRRITRRMVLNKQNSLEDYANFLRGNAKELDALYSDVLISVTSFFRSPEAFDVLKRKVFPKLLQQRGGEPLRVWVLGCSTGQEAYSIAMAFVESAENAPRMRKLQVFATDLNDALLDKARHGLYAKSVADEISPERLRRFFIEEQGGYRVCKPLREMAVFARHNLMSDPPFSRMDLISCRNLLIYLEPSLQKKALPTFHYALKPEGFLFLGASESIGSFTDLFEPADKKHKIYSKKAVPTPAFHLPIKRERGEQPSPGQRPPSPLPTGQGEAAEGFRAELNAQREADRVTVNQFAPPGVLINAELQILQFRGPTGAYLEPPTGMASFDVLKMAREGLMLPLRAAINKAKKETKTARKENVRVQQNGKTRTVNVEVIPLKNLRERCFLILFEEAEKAGHAIAGATPSKAIAPRGGLRTARATMKEESRRIAELETELSETRDYLQSIQEQHEAADEELQAANEEVQSANEELQSINEELETSKEELESANEELTTVNEEMANRNVELNRLNGDLINLQTSTKLAIVLLGRDLTIRRFSAQAEKQFDLLATDVGRPINNIRHNLVFPETGSTGDPPDLESFIAEVIASVREREREVRDKQGRWYSLRVRPYFTLDNKVDGAVLVLVDIDALKRSEQAIAAARDYAENAIETVREPLLVLDGQLRVESANRSFYRAFRVAPAETVGKSIFDLGDRQWDIPQLRTLLEEILPHNSSLEDFQVEHEFPQLGRRAMLVNARRIDDPARKTQRILLAIEDITERKQAEEKLRESEGRYRVLFDLGPVAVFSCDREGVIQQYNRLAAELWGREPKHGDFNERYCGSLKLYRPDGSFLPHSDSPIVQVLQTGVLVKDVDIFIERPDGSRIAVVVTFAPLKTERGEITGAITAFYDITQRREAEEALRRSEANLRDFVENASVGLDWVGPDGIILWANQTELDLLDYTREEYIGHNIAEFHADAPVIEDILARLTRGETLQEYEARLRRKDGSIRHVLINSNALFEDNQFVHTRCFTRDITERKQAEEALREAGERFRFLTESMPQKVFTAKPNGDVDYFNPEWTEFTGLTFEQMRDWGWTRFVHPDDVTENVRVWQHAIDTGEPFHFEQRFRRADGEYRWHISRAVALKDAGSKVLMWIGSNTDVHEVKEADRRKNEFLAMLAHELRNPLAPIRNMLEILKRADGNGDLIQQAESTMERQLGQMTRLIDDLLDVSRISRGKLDLRREQIELASVVHHAVEACRPAMESARHELIVTLPSQPVYLNADPTRLAQVVGNLLNNACKFTDKGGRISLTVEQEDEQAVIRVRDTGIGIPPEMLPHIFEMFTQGDQSLERSQGGLGIGLTLVRRLVEIHSGSVQAFSEGRGRGSELVVRLPVMLEKPLPQPSEPTVSEPTATTGRRILVVDDNRDSADSLVMLLKMTGNEAHIAYDGLEAVEAAATFRPDVILLDIGLPKLNGYDACRRIREQPWGKNIVLLALTGWGQDEDRQKSREAGFNGHLVKPVEHAALMKLLADKILSVNTP